MSSYQLSPLSASSSTQAARTPAHVSLSSDDLLAVLWPSGGLQVWNLHTRMHTGREKSMNPVLTWSSDEDGSGHFYRQVSLSTSDGILFRTAVLGSDNRGADYITVHDIDSDLASVAHGVKLPLRNGRLVTSASSVVWQGPDGKIYDSTISNTCSPSDD